MGRGDRARLIGRSKIPLRWMASARKSCTGGASLRRPCGLRVSFGNSSCVNALPTVRDKGDRMAEEVSIRSNSENRSVTQSRFSWRSEVQRATAPLSNHPWWPVPRRMMTTRPPTDAAHLRAYFGYEGASPKRSQCEVPRNGRAARKPLPQRRRSTGRLLRRRRAPCKKEFSFQSPQLRLPGVTTDVILVRQSEIDCS